MRENKQDIFGQGGCFAFHPVYSGDCKYTTGIFKFMKTKPVGVNPESIWEESSSIDDCIQIAIVHPEEGLENTALILLRDAAAGAPLTKLMSP